MAFSPLALSGRRSCRFRHIPSWLRCQSIRCWNRVSVAWQWPESIQSELLAIRPHRLSRRPLPSVRRRPRLTGLHRLQHTGTLTGHETFPAYSPTPPILNLTPPAFSPTSPAFSPTSPRYSLMSPSFFADNDSEAVISNHLVFRSLAQL